MAAPHTPEGARRGRPRRWRRPARAPRGEPRGRGGVLRAAARVARADLAGRPVQTALTALAIFVAATALVVTLALRSGLDDPFAQAQDATRGAHVGISRAHARRRADRAADAPRRAWSRATCARRRSARPRCGGGTVDVRLQGLPARRRARRRAARHRRPAPERPTDEVLLERSFARETGLRVGQRLTIAARGGGRGRRPLRVAGLAVTTQQADYPHWDPGLAWARRTPLSSGSAAPGTGTRVGVRLADPEAVGGLRRRRSRPALRGVGFTDWHDVRDTITDQARTNTIIIGVNTLLALIAVGFTVATVISGRVLAQRREIGLLKAIGADAARRRRACWWPSTRRSRSPPGVLGLVAGTLIAPALLEPMSNLLATPTPSAFQPGDAAGSRWR